MAFQQLYYTSCEHGLSGYAGYQFNAITPGIPAAVLREVEERTLYEPPRWRVTGPDVSEPEAQPVAFSYRVSEATGARIITHVVFAGTDYSGRPGNYFVHALVSSTPQQDLGALLPVDLWGASWWQSAPISDTELPEMAGPLPRGIVDQPSVQAFLSAHGAQDVLAELLTAIGRAMAGERPVLIASQDANENVWWIAAASYLMGEHLAPRMTFTTYSHRPGYAGYHLVGVVAGALPAEAGGSFQLFDFTSGRRPGHEPHPMATILADTGVLAVPGLWQQAAVFASGAEENLDDWLAPVALAAGLLGRKLSAGEVDTVARWLPGACSWLPPQHAEIALGAVLGQLNGELPADRLAGLLSVAQQLRAAAHAEQLERILAGRAIASITRGQQAQPLPLTGSAAAAAQNQVIQALDGVAPTVARDLLDWAEASGVKLPDAELARYGRTWIDPAAPAHDVVPVLLKHPAVLRGLLERLAAEPAEIATAVLAGPVGAQLTRDDLATHSELTELWLLQSALNGSIPPLRALDEIVDVRAGAARSPLVDGSLLHLLWPRGCPAGQVIELLGVMTDPPRPDILDWFAGEVRGISTRGTSVDDWVTLAQALSEHPILAMLPDAEARSVDCVMRVVPLLQRAYLADPAPDPDVFAQLFAEYTAAAGTMRALLQRDLPVLLGRASPLGGAVRGCPEHVAVAFGREVTERLAPLHADVALAARVFTARKHPDVLAQPGLVHSLTAAFNQVRSWRRRDLAALAEILDQDDAAAQEFQAWRNERPSLVRKLFRTGPGSPNP